MKLDVTDVPVLGRSQVDDRIVLTGAHAEEMRFHAGYDATWKCARWIGTRERTGVRTE